MSDTYDETSFGEPPPPLPADVMSPSEEASRVEDDLPLDDLPLHLRVLRAIVEGQPTQERIDHAISLANEIYELEMNADLED
jgi:hypothetical protein